MEGLVLLNFKVKFRRAASALFTLVISLKRRFYLHLVAGLDPRFLLKIKVIRFHRTLALKLLLVHREHRVLKVGVPHQFIRTPGWPPLLVARR